MKILLRWRILLTVYCLTALQIYGQEVISRTREEVLQSHLVFENFSQSDGLPEKKAWQMIQDHLGLIWMATESGLVRYDGQYFRLFEIVPGDNTSGINSLSGVIEDHNGELWVSTGSAGVWRFNPEEERFSPFVLDSSKGTSLTIFEVLEDKNNNLWVRSRFDGLYRINPPRDSVSHYVVDLSPDGVPVSLFGFFEDSHGRIWIGALGNEKGGLYLLNPDDGTAEQISYPFMGSFSEAVNGFAEDDKGYIWMATWGGIYRIDPVSLKVDSLDIPIIKSNAILVWDIHIDHNQNIWFASRVGLFCFNPKKNAFSHFQFDPLNPHSLQNNKTFSLMEDDQGNLWISTTTGISRIPLYHNQIYFLSLNQTVEDQKTLSFDGGINKLIFDNSGNLWAATQSAGTFAYNLTTDQYQNFLPGGLSYNVQKDDRGVMWVVASSGVFYYDDDNNKMVFIADDYPPISNDSVGAEALWVKNSKELWFFEPSGLYQIKLQPFQINLALSHKQWEANHISMIPMALLGDSEDHFFLTGGSSGLVWFDALNGSLKQFPEFGNSILVGSHVPHFYIDNRDRLVIPFQNQTNFYYVDDQGNLILQASFPNVVGAVHQDLSGNYWSIESDKITRLDPDREMMEAFNIRGLRSSLDGSFSSDSLEYLYLGTSGGIYVVNPSNFKHISNKYELLFSDLRIKNHSVPIAANSSDTLSFTLPKSMLYLKSLTLPHNMNDFSIELSCLDYSISRKVRYKYQLTGYQKDTVFLKPGDNQAVFTNLSPGNFTLKVWATDQENQWSNQPNLLPIQILAPWYWSWWSKLLYLSILISLIFVFYSYHIGRRLARAEAQQMRIINTMQSRMYTNITHEFRTPLTVISGMVDQILKEPEIWFRDGLAMIKRNTGQVLDLVNQMMDLAKIESGKLNLHWIQGDLIAYIKYLSETYTALASQCDIQFHLIANNSSLMMDFDPDKFQLILTNLVYNAIKFTDPGGQVYLIVEQDSESRLDKNCIIHLKDTGIGIAEEGLSKIFNRFYQTDDSSTRKYGGTGIGLALVKEYVTLLGGNILVNSKLGEGTQFTIIIPIHHNAKIKENQWSTANSGFSGLAPHLELRSAESSSEANLDYPLALIIEDNPDVQTYISGLLKTKYRVITAPDGESGADKAFKHIPDIIISDIMMPKKDGYELVDALKTDERTSHIPIILLTAKADEESRLEGLLKGADAFLTKPFNPKELEIIISQQLKIREQLQKSLAQIDQLREIKPQQINEVEERFIRKIHLVLETNLDSESFGVPELCQALGISRTQLHRKLKAISNSSTSQFIRNYRMQKAKELLLTTDMNVTEVGYAVGYINRSHFSQDFVQVMGQPPSSYKK
ncbi:MAG: response regulator [Saprospiraceae bacterium]|nr:response regulator [Saprospiraceae bacterium]MCB9320326.1 response regulator [Lewinellaceae bacterium]